MKLLLTLILTCICFSSANAIDRTFTYSCPDDCATEVQNAIDLWNQAADGIFHATRVHDDATITFKEVNRIKGGYRGLTETGWSGKHIQIKIVTDCEHRDVVIMHEIGHAFGLKHTQDTNSVMFHSAKDEPILSEDDIHQIRKRYGLKNE